MTSQHEKPKRWRLRFSVRTLVVVVTLVAAYFGLWEATKRHGCQAFSRGYHNVSSPCPLIVTGDRLQIDHPEDFRYYRSHYFWCFGYVCQLRAHEVTWLDVLETSSEREG